MDSPNDPCHLSHNAQRILKAVVAINPAASFTALFVSGP